ncbi:MAG: copper homeostasis protein CutC [Bacteroidetes bacterium]|nr:copper homeostasis protein CutC [Bacteroidota bacterium]MBU1372302.1 copper homeostasis protein CutC [Bacteroidota bacterium]MBU1486065.1 copper homeostasis protein CutC [Bacteroidota bacterium]MBU2267070.1 copper homeostasis protein CutC [Bacteroidota bacterium]MBU2376723.1 copper homeostasis protein CutC [Bacteroidota bacterium]
MKKYQLEIACFNLQSALIAEANGADRIEFCDRMDEGGTTPDFEITKTAKEKLSIPLYVMIRPRGGSFVYDEVEFNQMKADILKFKKLKIDGFVFGILTKDGSIDHEKNTALVALAHPIPCTFHRAFDLASSVFRALEEVIDCGFKTILTSGQEANVVEGIDTLTQLVEKANNRIIMMPGGGLRSTNIKSLKEKTKAVFYHSSAIVDSSETANAKEVKMLKMKLTI